MRVHGPVESTGNYLRVSILSTTRNGWLISSASKVRTLFRMREWSAERDLEGEEKEEKEEEEKRILLVMIYSPLEKVEAFKKAQPMYFSELFWKFCDISIA
jgi:hypothetical protein